jgi:hypothetical protein
MIGESWRGPSSGMRRNSVNRVLAAGRSATDVACGAQRRGRDDHSDRRIAALIWTLHSALRSAAGQKAGVSLHISLVWYARGAD